MTGALLLAAALAQAPAEPAPEDAPSALVIGAEAFGEFFPASTKKVPMRTQPQQSVLTGVRLLFGFRYAARFRGFALFEAGYAAAGIEAGRGQDGFMAGAGAEGQWIVHRFFMFIVRLMGDVKVAQRATNTSGTLADSALVFSFGVRLIRFLELHASYGNDFAGGSAFGFGAALGWSWAFDV
jgi:hypothetical protein